MDDFLQPFIDAELLSNDPGERLRGIVVYLGHWTANTVGITELDGFMTPEFLIHKLSESFPIFSLGLESMTRVVAYLDQDMDSVLMQDHSTKSYETFTAYFSARLKRDLKLQDELDEDVFEAGLSAPEASDPHPNL